MDTESQISQLLVKAGESKSYAFEALGVAKEGNFAEAETLLKKSVEVSLEAHKFHMALIQKDIAGEAISNPMFLMHAEDHLMSSMLARELIIELIENQKQIQNLQEQIGGK